MSAADGFDLLSHCIDGKLAGLTPWDTECCIFKVHSRLRKVNEKAYEPELVAIGPYHRGKDDLKQMEDNKLLYLQQLLQRRNERSVERYIKAMREMKGRARRCYAGPISLTRDEFVEMMLLDGCFIIELFRKWENEELGDECDPIFQFGWMADKVLCDVLLFENQLPLFVLNKLMEMTQVADFIYNFQRASERLILVCVRPMSEFLGLLQNNRHVSRALAHNVGNQVGAQNISHLLALAYNFVTRPVQSSTSGNVVEWNSIPNATELQEAGVKFKKLEGVNLFDIKFNNGVMKIPLLRIEDKTESMIRNLIAYEQYSQIDIPKYFTEYIKFMDYLIDSPKDVELLRRRGIIENWLGSDEVVSTMFNKLSDFVIFGVNLYYAQIVMDVNKHCHRRRNVWIAKLRHNYFNSPWALISFVAAAFLLLLALTQTIFTVLSYIVPKSNK